MKNGDVVWRAGGGVVRSTQFWRRCMTRETARAKRPALDGMLQRYIHPTDALKLETLETGSYLVTNRSQNAIEPAEDGRLKDEVRACERILVDGKGIEPMTSALRTRRSPS